MTAKSLRPGLLVTALLLAGACDFNITNPNLPPVIGPNATQARVASAVAGVLIGARTDMANWVLKSSIFGREGYRIDVADPRFITELLQGPLDPSNAAFGGGQWPAEYATIRSGYNILNVLSSAQLTAAEKNGVQGVVQTMQAFVYIIVLDAHTEDSIPIDVNHPVTDPPAPFVTNQVAWAHVATLLDSAATALGAAGGSFAIPLPNGLADFSTPATFLQLNRALLARVDAYRASAFAQPALYDSVLTALGQSFVDTTKAMDLGAAFDYGTGQGDIANPLFQAVTSAIQVAHRSVQDSVENKVDLTPDNRYLAKVTDRGSQLCGGTPALCSSLSWIRYRSPTAPIPLIRNEELILLRAEANNFKTVRNAPAAAADINAIRVRSGGLTSDAGLAAASADSVKGVLLRERKYSLLFEGHRWVDMRRLGRFTDILIDRPTKDKRFLTLPIPLFEVQPRLP